jgi:hypothetical protein
LKNAHNFISVIRKFSVFVFYVICLAEGIWALYSIWVNSSITSASLFSLNARSALIFFLLFVVLMFGILAIAEWGFPARRFSLDDWIITHNKIFVITAMGLLVSGFTCWVLVFSPLHIPLIRAYYLRWQPIFVWAGLVSIQFILLGLTIKPALFWIQTTKEVFESLAASAKRACVRLDSWPYGLMFLGISFLLGLTKISFGQFVDEADNLAYGWMITQGNVLYRDLFSQHFPLAYYWSAGVVAVFGNSQAIARVSILVLQFGVFAYCMRATRLYFPIGLTALAWGLTSHFHRGNLLLYDTFDGIFLTSTAILVFSILLERSQVKRSVLVMIGFLLGLALLSNPLSIYPATVAAIAIGLSVIGLDWKSGLHEGLRRLFWVVLPIGVVVGAYGAYLFISGTWKDFYWQVIWFNANIYGQYTDTNPNRLGQIAYQLARGLDVLNPQYRQIISPFLGFGIERYRMANEDQYYSWIFSSLTFRLSILLCTVSLLLRRKVLPAIFLYVFSASLLIRAETSWHAIPFIWLSLFAGAYYLVNMASPPRNWTTGIDQEESWKSSLFWLGRFAWRTVYLLLLVLFTWSAIRGAQFLIQNRKALFDRQYIHQLEVFGDEIRQLTCNQSDVEMLIYPFDPMTYFVTQIPPASRYTHLHPWIAQIALPDVIAELKNHPSAVVQVKTERQMWQKYPVKVFLADLILYLNQNYIKINESLWMSPELALRCGAAPP